MNSGRKVEKGGEEAWISQRAITSLSIFFQLLSVFFLSFHFLLLTSGLRDEM